MRAEDQLKVDEEEDVQEIVQGLEEGRDDEQAEEKAAEELPAAARHFQHVVAAMRSVLEGVDVEIDQIVELSREEREAFEVLKQVVHARGRRGAFIYAEQRLAQLNQVLAVLQPALSIGSAPGVEAVSGELAIVIDEVCELRDKLTVLEAAEEELEPRAEEKEAEGDKDDDDDEDDTAGEVPEPGAPARPSTLSAGAAVPERKPAPTTLTGTPAAPDFEPPPTTLTGTPEAPDFEPPPSTLGDAEDAPAAKEPAPAATDAKPARSRKAKQ